MNIVPVPIPAALGITPAWKGGLLNTELEQSYSKKENSCKTTVICKFYYFV